MKSSRGKGLAARALGQLEQDFGAWHLTQQLYGAYRDTGIPADYRWYSNGGMRSADYDYGLEQHGAHVRTTAAIHIHLFSGRLTSLPYGECSKTPVTHDV